MNRRWGRGGVATDRPAGGYRFVPRGRHGVPGIRGSVNSSEVCMLRERSFQELPRVVPLGRHQTRRNAVTPTRLRCTHSLFLGRGKFCWIFGENLFLSQFSSVFCSSSSRLKIVLNTYTRRQEKVASFWSASEKNTSNSGNQCRRCFRKNHRTHSSS